MKRETETRMPHHGSPASRRAPTPLVLHRGMHRRPTRLAWSLACALAIGVPGLAQADAVLDWNERATEATAALPLPIRLRAMAMVQIAVHDSLNAIDPRYRTYSVVAPANSSASPDAAVATAAHKVLLSVLPAPPADGYDAYIATLPPCGSSAPHCIADGKAAGTDAASAIVHERSTDDLSHPHLPYTDAAAPGVYQLTPGVPFAAFEGWQDITPFAIRSKRQFRSPPSQLFNLRSWLYTANYIQVKWLGSAAARGGVHENSEMSRIARFWYGTGGHDWFATTRAIVANRHLDRWQHARLFALLAMGQVDSTISVFHDKYRYRFWRPVTAIRWLHDGNPLTVPDPDWTPYLRTPPYPDYPCGTPMLAGAGTEVLRNFFGTDRVPYTVTSTYAPPPPGMPEQITRSYRSLTGAAAETAIARVYAGIHFGTGCEVGVEQGEKIGHWVTGHYLRPTPRGH